MKMIVTMGALVALSACAAGPNCSGRLTPINPAPVRAVKSVVRHPENGRVVRTDAPGDIP